MNNKIIEILIVLLCIFSLSFSYVSKNDYNYKNRHHITVNSNESLFGGGGSISFMLLQAKQFKKVHYNEYNPAIVNLLKYVRDNGVTDEFYKWVSREEFEKNVNRTDWYGGLLKTL